jgi:hypothetical protein
MCLEENVQPGSIWKCFPLDLIWSRIRVVSLGYLPRAVFMFDVVITGDTFNGLSDSVVLTDEIAGGSVFCRIVAVLHTHHTIKEIGTIPL